MTARKMGRGALVVAMFSLLAACSSLGGGSSRTLAALGLPADATRRTLRFSAGWETSPDDWAALAAACLGTATELQAETSAH